MRHATHRMRSRRFAMPTAAAPCATRWRVVATSAAGTHHRHRDEPGQDSYAFNCGDEMIFVAIADGVSSASRGGEGATLATHTAITAMRAGVAAGVVCRTTLDTSAGPSARDAVLQEATAADVPSDSYATTLLVAVVDADGTVSAAQIGDGVVIYIAPDGQLHRLVSADITSYANVVESLTGAAALQMVRCATAAHTCGVILTTDGLETVAMGDAETPHPAFFAPMLRHLSHTPDDSIAAETLAEWLISDAVAAVTDDDATLLFVIPTIPNATPEL